MNNSRAFMIGSGLLSLVVILYASFMHGTMIVMFIYSSRDQLLTFSSRLFGNPIIIGLHAIVCIFGAALAIIFMVDAFRNSSIPKLRRLIWVPALACGYGLVFYWYFYVLHRTDCAVPPNL